MTGEISRVNFLGLGFDSQTTVEALASIENLSRESGFSYVVTPNVDHMVRLHKRSSSHELWDAYFRASLCFCDSRVLQKLARLSGLRLTLLPGSDLTVALAKVAEQFSGIAVVGGDAKLGQELVRLYPAVHWHQHIPPMGVRDNPQAQESIVQFVESCPADVFLFAIGSPQSEILCERISRRGSARGVALCIGASLEFVTGSKRRAPRWMQMASLEWLFRLLSEPLRLWRRYLVEGPSIVSIWLRWQLNAAHPDAESDSSLTDVK